MAWTYIAKHYREYIPPPLNFFALWLQKGVQANRSITTTSSKQTPVACWLDTTAATFHMRIVKSYEHPLFFTPRSCLILTPSSQIENGIFTVYPKIPKLRQNNVRSICQSFCILTVDSLFVWCFVLCCCCVVWWEDVVQHYLKKSILSSFQFSKRCKLITRPHYFKSNHKCILYTTGSQREWLAHWFDRILS